MLFKTGTRIAYILSTFKIQCYEKLSVFQFVLLISSWSWSSGESSLTRALYDSMARLGRGAGLPRPLVGPETNLLPQHLAWTL